MGLNGTLRTLIQATLKIQYGENTDARQAARPYMPALPPAIKNT